MTWGKAEIFVVTQLAPGNTPQSPSGPGRSQGHDGFLYLRTQQQKDAYTDFWNLFRRCSSARPGYAVPIFHSFAFVSAGASRTRLRR
ncbi:hypothetical protein P8C59_007321 [Phyllachora maydis]|uniref:Uncharacterized protein n=1 Tax=Phyllachora maydis TaxID=1825666 RepID=A0AAD9ME42_9PEZI|nr:hypothetical protein P8C59_007321 [Phyllachora maydis]